MAFECVLLLICMVCVQASSLNLAHIEQFHTLSVDVSRTVVASVDHARAVIDKTKALQQQCQSIQQLEQQVYVLICITLFQSILNYIISFFNFFISL